MKEYSFRKDGFTFERVSKATARRVFNNNMPIMLCPCNLRPETGLFSTVVQNGKHLNTTFETQVLIRGTFLEGLTLAIRNVKCYKMYC